MSRIVTPSPSLKMDSSKNFIIEVCVDSVESATEALAGGATRLEICANLAVGGGTTPSLGLVRRIRSKFPDVDLMIMIRPRIGDFVFTEDELATMLEDIDVFTNENIAGVVIGVLCANGTVDIKRTQTLVRAAKPMQVCFHRAIDMTRDPLEAIRDISSIGDIDRILTSGHNGPSVFENTNTLALMSEFLFTLSPPMTILPGSGVNANTIRTIVQDGWWKRFRQVHLSAGRWVNSPMSFRKENMGMGAGGNHDWKIWRTDQNVVARVREIVEDVCGHAID